MDDATTMDIFDRVAYLPHQRRCVRLMVFTLVPDPSQELSALAEVKADVHVALTLEVVVQTDDIGMLGRYALENFDLVFHHLSPPIHKLLVYNLACKNFSRFGVNSLLHHRETPSA